jgi:Tfp pilus assembly protein PilX
MAWLELLRRYWPVLALVATLAGGYWAGHVQGVATERHTWSAKWEKRNTDDATAQSAAESAARAKEQALQQQAEKVQRDATQALETARTDAAGERAATERLRGELTKLQTRLGGTGASSPAGTSSASATRAAMVLSELYGSCQSRLGEVSSAFDRARIAGLACEASYDGLRH